MKYGIQEYYFNVFRNLVVQCNLLDVKDWPERITFFSWYLFCLIVVALYAGMLTAVLAVPEFEEPVDSLTDLAKAVKQGFTLGVTRESSNEYIFRDATKGIFKEVWGLFNHEDRSKSFVASPSIGMKKILEEKFIFIWFETLGKNFAAGLGSYKFHISRESFFPQSFSYPVPPGAPYKETFSRLIMRIVEGGIMSKWEDDVFRRNPQTQTGNRRDFTAITLTHLQAAFILLIIGFLIAFGALTLEKVTVSCSRRYPR
ncbi:glutamate receptor ionotropic, kainate 2-like [Macrobrachium nipponense]|uniref:glutamate receptor ionotropic, kainate 2-like n=1 Tax=Macrobrachium nipponense TaxID=159736 RepID=UPI0030C86A2D